MKLTKLKTAQQFWLLVFAGILIWVATDLYVPRQHSIRQFDPNSVARIETGLWRSYHTNSSFRFYRQLAGGLRNQFNSSYWRSYGLALQASRAVFVFQEGKSRTDYSQALPLLEDYYTALQQLTGESFEIKQVARLELESWIVRRERTGQSTDKLAAALAQTAGALYSLPPARFTDYAQLRALAMQQYDNAQPRGIKEADWQRIEQQLHWAWQGLYRVVVVSPSARK